MVAGCTNLLGNRLLKGKYAPLLSWVGGSTAADVVMGLFNAIGKKT